MAERTIETYRTNLTHDEAVEIAKKQVRKVIRNKLAGYADHLTNEFDKYIAMAKPMSQRNQSDCESIARTYEAYAEAIWYITGMVDERYLDELIVENGSTVDELANRIMGGDDATKA